MFDRGLQQQAATRFNQMLAEGRVIRSKWADTDDEGREIACALAAMVPEVGSAEDVATCPAELMPQWFAEMVLFIGENLPSDQWDAQMHRLGNLAGRWYVLGDKGWGLAEVKFKSHFMEIALANAEPLSARLPAWGKLHAVVARMSRAPRGWRHQPLVWIDLLRAATEIAKTSWSSNYADLAAVGSADTKAAICIACLDILEAEIIAEETGT